MVRRVIFGLIHKERAQIDNLPVVIMGEWVTREQMTNRISPTFRRIRLLHRVSERIRAVKSRWPNLTLTCCDRCWLWNQKTRIKNGGNVKKKHFNFRKSQELYCFQLFLNLPQGSKKEKQNSRKCAVVYSVKKQRRVTSQLQEHRKKRWRHVLRQTGGRLMSRIQS